MGHADVAELLISKGAKIDAKTKGGLTPLNMATTKGHNEVVKLLRRHGAGE
jgi:ankyrin